MSYQGCPDGSASKEPTWQCRRLERFWFYPWVGKIPLEKGLATDSSILAGIILWTEDPGGLQSMQPQRVGHDWAQHSTAHSSCWVFLAVVVTFPLCADVHRLLLLTHVMWTQPVVCRFQSPNCSCTSFFSTWETTLGVTECEYKAIRRIILNLL